MPARTAVVVVLALWPLLACADMTMKLPLPHAPAAGEVVQVHVVAGALPLGARIVVRLPDGQLAGSATPYGVRGGQPAGEYIIPLPPLPSDAVRDGWVRLRFEIDEKGKTRAPKKGEVRSADLSIVPAG